MDLFQALVAVSCILIPCQVERRPPPDNEAQAAALKLIREIFKDDYGRKTPLDRQALARKLLQQAPKSKDDPTSQYVLLEEARRLATETGDVETIIQATNDVANRFTVDRTSLKLSSLLASRMVARTPPQFAQHADALLTLVDEAMEAQDPESAEKASAAAAAAARAAKSMPLISKAETRSKEVASLKGKVSALKKAREVLATNPDDPAANHTVGSFLCLSLGNFEQGLPYLLKCSDASLKALASRDLEAPTGSSDQLLLADSWWDLAEKESGKSRELARARACTWYKAALPDLAGLPRAKVEKRLKEVLTATRGKSIDLLRLIDPAKDTRGGACRMVSQSLVVSNSAGHAFVQIPYAPPDEYDLEVEAEFQEGTGILPLFAIGLRHFLVLLEAGSAGRTGLHLLDGIGAASNETNVKGAVFTKGATRTILCQVRHSGVRIEVDGKTLVDWSGELRRLTTPDDWKNPDPKALFIGSHDSTFSIRNILLSPVSGGKGVLLR